MRKQIFVHIFIETTFLFKEHKTLNKRNVNQYIHASMSRIHSSV